MDGLGPNQVDAAKAADQSGSAAGAAGVDAAPVGLPADSAALCARAVLLRSEVTASVMACRSIRLGLPASRLGARPGEVGVDAAGADGSAVVGARPPASAFTVVVAAASAGGLQPLLRILRDLPADFPAAVLVVQHRTAESRLAEFLAARVRLPVVEARDGDVLTPGNVLVAPAHRHVSIGRGGRVSVVAGPRINFVCPCADVTFESAAAAFGPRAVAVVLSGCGSDGADGTRAVRRSGGTVIAQYDRSAEYPDMPIAAVDRGKVDLILPVDRIGPALIVLAAGDAGHPVRPAPAA